MLLVIIFLYNWNIHFSFFHKMYEKIQGSYCFGQILRVSSLEGETLEK